MKSTGAKIFAAAIHLKNKAWISDPLKYQKKTFSNLIKKAKNTSFGKDHFFENITNYEDFKKAVPVRDYEGLRPYVEKMLEGDSDVLWPGKPLYYAKTSGTTSGVKYIPISKESMPAHIQAARDALLNYIHQTGNTDFVKGKQIFLQGSPILDKKGDSTFGRLSGIVAHYVPCLLYTSPSPRDS